ncbi:hypothetical protein E1B28_010644 [Marasmius oreades]|uniref:DUF6533 domain-containing protein n=1 Tax=Marasmius oreades TaxID=181124 RepID=A0A9P7URZ8_9AGAR|nr:uncharacterized protein E1B28_010644 [Marasmius oreades]KAG7091625.1 hypothetical protein E1B28_010644 [Marasmius oreades]
MVEIPPDVDLVAALQHEVVVRVSFLSDNADEFPVDIDFQYLFAAGEALFIYDVLLNLDVEIEYIWAVLSPRKRPVKITAVLFSLMYLVQRYLPLFDQIILNQYFILGASTKRACMITYAMCGWVSLAGISLSEIILVIRIWAVWGWKPLIGVILVVISVAGGIPGIFFLSRFLNGIQYPELDIPGVSEQLQRCFYMTTNKEIVVTWILLMVYDMVGFILMAIPGISAYRSSGSSNLVKVVYRDGVIYYALIFMISLINVIVILILSPDLRLLLSGFERVLHSILASRVILHIRKMASQDNIHGQTPTSTGIMLTTIEFTSFTGTENGFTANMNYRSFELEVPQQTRA